MDTMDQGQANFATMVGDLGNGSGTLLDGTQTCHWTGHKTCPLVKTMSEN